MTDDLILIDSFYLRVLYDSKHLIKTRTKKIVFLIYLC